MTPICYCAKPQPVRTDHPGTKYYGPYQTVHCLKCGYHYATEHGSTPAEIVSAPPTSEGGTR